VPPLNRIIEFARKEGWAIFASRDWHPPVTKHFKEYGGIWPVHCVAGSKGAEFHKDLDISNAIIVSKGMGNNDDYSAFDGVTESSVSSIKQMPLRYALRAKGIDQVVVGGLATDYCVKETALAASKLGFIVTFLSDASKAVNLKPDDEMNAIHEMKNLGVRIMTVNEVING